MDTSGLRLDNSQGFQCNPKMQASQLGVLKSKQEFESGALDLRRGIWRSGPVDLGGSCFCVFIANSRHLLTEASKILYPIANVH